MLDLAGVAVAPLLATLAVSLLAGAALLVTLVDLQLLAETMLGRDAMGGALLLLRFLAALPVGALAGGLLVRRLGERPVTVAGMALAGVAYLLVAAWPEDILAARHALGPVSLPRFDVDLALAGLGLGLVIAPLASAVLRVAPATAHGTASAAVVVTRMIGMLLGVTVLSGWGLHRFHQLMAESGEAASLAEYAEILQAAMRAEYAEIFTATAGICLLGALVALALPGRRESEVAGGRRGDGCCSA